MPHQLKDQSYGKSRVRLSRIDRGQRQHDFIELAVDIALRGEFEEAYTEGVNQLVLPTDTIKNTVYALAKRHGVASCESFAVLLANHFTQNFRHIRRADVSVHESLWQRIQMDGSLHPHAFVGGGGERNTCVASVADQEASLSSGLDGLQVLKTTGSGFSDFLHDQYTTLAATDDRILATTISATWVCNSVDEDWTLHRAAIRQAMLEVFANNYSPSVQKTLFEMAEAAFAACDLIDEMSIAMPNQHHLLARLDQLQIENENEVFVPTSEPFGMIAATVKRNER